MCNLVSDELSIWFHVDFSLMQDVDSELALHLKRLARKDPTTKVTLCKHACF